MSLIESGILEKDNESKQSVIRNLSTEHLDKEVADRKEDEIDHG